MNAFIASGLIIIVLVVIVIWSKMYDNVQESIDAPIQSVMEDDDALDGWFIVQNRKYL